ncbi:ABC transporter permease [Flavobacterium sp.]|jgi:lipopolysaccharide transport system permease protein|uniref:ABC transporter permease n=1 Tax=Flavobacterium sp. TaxID=239 RepID=UPI0022C4F232|nr:ABC transporter permease [Flavobacterium sp.]MCZ8144144.1 ABC transporter permease [Flavobacterium sp.]MCZ8366235.1 ABC transporter permease [Flavobacterium sp.]
MAQHEQHWTEEIRSEHSLFSINFKEVWRYRDLLFMLLKRDFITFYKQTILGPLWFIIQPLLTTLIYIVLFVQVAKIDVGGVPSLAFYLSGVTIWNYFSDSLIKTANVFQGNASVFGKVYFPRLIMPLSVVFSSLMKFVIQFLLFVGVVVYYAYVTDEIKPNMWVLMTPILLLMMACFALGVGMIFSSMTTKYKDLSFLLAFGVQLYMYATPVVYPITAMPDKYRWIVSLNPLTSIFECYRFGYLGEGHFEPQRLLYSAIIIIILLLTGTLIFNKVEKSFMDTI